MLKLILAATMAILLIGQVVCAEDYDTCVSNYEKAYNDCMNKAAKYVNDIEVKDAEAACSSSMAGVRAACDDAEANRGGRGPDPDVKKEEGEAK